jgi:nucleoid-associated protein YgaU
MLSRTLAVPTLLAAAVGGPYVATNAPQWAREWQTAAPAAPAANGAAPPAPANAPADAKRMEALTASPTGPGAALYPTPTPLEGAPTYSLAEVFRLDVTKEWVYQRWPRKSTALSSLDLFGVRVPLVTGTQLHDVAGSLTYFFGVDGRCHRITFRGRTGDTSQLLGMLAHQHGLQAYPTAVAGEQLLQLRRGNDVISECRTRPAPVLWSSSPHDSFSIELELQNPATARPIKPQLAPIPPAPQAAAPAPAKPTATPAAAPAQTAVAAPPAPPAAPAPSTESGGWRGFFSRMKPTFDQNDVYR